MFTRILVPLDGSPLAEQAIPRAVSLAKGARAHIQVLMVHEGWSDRRYIDTAAADIREAASVPTKGTIVHGSPAEAIVARARETGADLIVMTSHGRTGISRLWLGSVADHVVRAATIPVLVLPADEDKDAAHEAHDMVEAFGRLLVPYDGSPLSADALPVAADLARISGAAVTLLQISPVVPAIVPVDPTLPTPVYPVIPDEEATVRLATDVRHGLEEVAARLAKESGLAVRAVVEVSQNTSDRIVEYAHIHRADVIVMSTHGRGRSRWLLGSVADKVLRASRLPTVLRRPAGVAESIMLDEATVAHQKI